MSFLFGSLHDLKIRTALLINKCVVLSLFLWVGVFLALQPVLAQTSQVTVVILGDSLTAGYGVAKQNSYASLLETIAREQQVSLRVINAGLSGDTSAGGVRRVEGVLQREPCDIFILELGGNDALRGLSPKVMEDNLRSILQKVRQQAPTADLVIAGMEAPPNLGTTYQMQFHNAFKTLAVEFNARLIPFLLAGVAADPTLNQADGIHPNEKGHALIAPMVWDTIEPLVRQRLKTK